MTEEIDTKPMTGKRCGHKNPHTHLLVCDLPDGHEGDHTGAACLYPEQDAPITRHWWGSNNMCGTSAPSPRDSSTSVKRLWPHFLQESARIAEQDSKAINELLAKIAGLESENNRLRELCSEQSAALKWAHELMEQR